MNIPNIPPMPNPITPDTTDLPKQDSINWFSYYLVLVCIILSSQGLSSERLGQVDFSVTDSLDVRIVSVILLRPSLRGAGAW